MPRLQANHGLTLDTHSSILCRGFLNLAPKTRQEHYVWAVLSLPVPTYISASHTKDIEMRLTQEQWFVIARAVSFVGELAREDRAGPILKCIGRDGGKAARKGIAPSPEIAATCYHEAIGVDEKALDEVIRMQEEAMNLKALLMDLGNRLVRKHGFQPAQAILDRTRDAAFLRSTQMIAMFVAWLNHVPEARKMLADYGWEWPLGHCRGRGQDDSVAVQ